jgi:tetratricopeptide (TPR) repeat protein
VATGELRSALSAEPEKALAAYQRMAQSGLTPDLEPADELKLAMLLDKSGDARGAVLACRRAAKRQPQGPLAPRAIFTAARLLAERMGKPVDAKAMYQYLIQAFPAHELSVQAREKLALLDSQNPS